MKSKKEYPELIRRIKFFDEETGNTYVFLTHNFELDALLITQLYKERWKVELFFKWIKQHLRIKNFYGTSYNAVCCQIWISVCTYLLVAIVKKILNLKEHSLYNLLQIFSLTLFEKVPIYELFTKNDYKLTSPIEDKQLKLFDLQPDTSDILFSILLIFLILDLSKPATSILITIIPLIIK